MIDSILRMLVSARDNAFESYYQRVLEHAGKGGAPTLSEARRDYERFLRTRREY